MWLLDSVGSNMSIFGRSAQLSESKFSIDHCQMLKSCILLKDSFKTQHEPTHFFFKNFLKQFWAIIDTWIAHFYIWYIHETITAIKIINMSIIPQFPVFLCNLSLLPFLALHPYSPIFQATIDFLLLTKY